MLAFVLAMAMTSTTVLPTPDTTVQGIPVYFELVAPSLPKPWQKSLRRAKYQVWPLAVEKRKETCATLGTVLSAYPDSLIRQHLHALFFADSVYHAGVKVGGGTYTQHGFMCMSSKAAGDSVNLWYLEKNLHHELSHLLLDAYWEYFDPVAWRSLTAVDYGKGSLDFFRKGLGTTDLDSMMHSVGLLYAYAGASLHEDFASIAESLFMRTAEFAAICASYPALEAKRRLVEDFYGKLHPQFTRRWFRQPDAVD